jgi:8-oxo-dGTP pyrophosphatase MutT (NUDIX family)
LIKKKTVFASSILSVNLRTDKNSHNKKIVTIDSPNWVNIIPITPSNKIVFVEQLRYGVDKKTLEIPGGMVDCGESSSQSATRELMEETSYQPEKVIKLGTISPNPALFSNHVTSYVAYGVKKIPYDHTEENITTKLISRFNVNELIRNGHINHALVIAAFHLLNLRDKNAHNA